MRALVYHGSGQRSWDQVPDPRIQDDFDAIVGIDAVTICGTDLHILKGDVPEVEAGRVLGHEAVGTVEAVGSAVRLRGLPSTSALSPSSARAIQARANSATGSEGARPSSRWATTQPPSSGSTVVVRVSAVAPSADRDTTWTPCSTATTVLAPPSH